MKKERLKDLLNWGMGDDEPEEDEEDEVIECLIGVMETQLKFQQLLCTWVAMGHWPQRPGQSQSVNLEQLTHQHSLKSGGWPGFEPGSLTFMASALTTKLPTKLVEMSARLLTDGSRTFYQGLHCTYR